MNISLDAHNRLEIHSGPENLGSTVSLHSGLPVINGVRMEPYQARVKQETGGFTVVYTPFGCAAPRFGIQAHLPERPGDPAWLQYWVEGFPDGALLDSFGLHFTEVSGARAFLRQGYHSWDGSYYVHCDGIPGAGETPGEAPQVTLGFAVTQLLPRGGDQNLVLGFDRHDRFQHTFTFTKHQNLEATITTLWDQKNFHSLARCCSELLLILVDSSAEAGLRRWAEHVAAASPLPPRLPAPRITGWCSWYNLYAAITAENLREHLQSTRNIAQRDALTMWVFQIDDGFTPEMGDWLEIKPQFPAGVKSLLNEIRSAGFIPGLWIAPFVVGNRSRLFRDHPGWVVQDRATGGPLVQSTFYGEFRWHKRSEEYYILDATHPEAFEYLRTVFHTWRHDWGCEYFKTDFMFYGSEHGPDRAAYHTPGKTRIEIWRTVAKMIREVIGDALWLGCGCPLWASAGLVDAIRTGRDVGVSWPEDTTAIERLRDTAMRNFAHGVLWQADPDVVLLRERFHHLSDAEVRSLALYSGLTGGVLMTSDDLQALSSGRLALWKFLQDLPPGGCNFPLLDRCAAAFTLGGTLSGAGSTSLDPLLVLVRSQQSGPPGEMVLLFNPSRQQVDCAYALSDLGIGSPRYAFEWVTGSAAPEPVDTLTVQIPPHDGRLFLLSPQLENLPQPRFP